MTIKTVKYEKLFPTGAYLNEKIGFEAELDIVGKTSINPSETGVTFGLEDPLAAIERLRILAEQSHKQKYPHLYTESGSPVFIEQVQETRSEEEISRSQQIEGYRELIKLADTPQKLERHRGNIEKLNDPELKTLFDNKLKELSK